MYNTYMYIYVYIYIDRYIDICIHEITQGTIKTPDFTLQNK